MDRRGFLSMMVGGLATAAAVRAFPFRVFSFPNKIIVPKLTLLNRAGIFEAGEEVVLSGFTGMRYYDFFPEYIGPYMGLRRDGISDGKYVIKSVDTKTNTITFEA